MSWASEPAAIILHWELKCVDYTRRAQTSPYAARDKD